MLVDLCGGKLQHSINHPTRPGERLFLLFDFTHNFKNIFNNFINKDRMHLPTHGYEDMLGETCTAFFSHIKCLYAMEEQKTLKIAFALKKASLNPSSIARTSPQHALTRRKKDDMFAPMQTSGAEDPIGLQYLKKATDIFVKWKASGFSGLTSETFLACIQTMGALPELTEYLQKKHDFLYILSGKLMSDPIEARFGWYRQVNGGNFFMSIKQLMQAEKKIRSMSLIQQEGLHAASRMALLQVSPVINDGAATSASSDVSWLVEFLSDVNLDDLSEADANVTYFVSGYIGRSISRRRKCSYCKELFVSQDEGPEILECVPEEHKHLFQMADRGGLSAPTELCFAITALAVRCYTAIVSDEYVKSKLLTMCNQRAAFTCAILQIQASGISGNLLGQECLAKHSNAELVISSAFNCFAKNELKRLNASNDAPAVMVHNRKVRKLSGKSSNKK